MTLKIVYSGAQNNYARASCRLLDDIGLGVTFITAQNCPRLGFDYQSLMLDEQIRREDDTATEFVICDRGVLDIYAYAVDAHARKLITTGELEILLYRTMERLDESPYFEIYMCRPRLDAPLYDNGARSMDKMFQLRMARIFEELPKILDLQVTWLE